MSYFNRVCMAASVAIVNGHGDHGQKLKSCLKSLHNRKKQFASSSSGSCGDGPDFRPLAGMLGSDVGGFFGNDRGEEIRKQADESFRIAMYMNCWGQS